MSEPIGLMAHSIVHIDVSSTIEDVSKTMITSCHLGTISRSVCSSQVDHQTITNVDTTKLCGDYGITAND